MQCHPKIGRESGRPLHLQDRHCMSSHSDQRILYCTNSLLQHCCQVVSTQTADSSGKLSDWYLRSCRCISPLRRVHTATSPVSLCKFHAHCAGMCQSNRTTFLDLQLRTSDRERSLKFVCEVPKCCARVCQSSDCSRSADSHKSQTAL